MCIHCDQVDKSFLDINTNTAVDKPKSWTESKNMKGQKEWEKLNRA